MDQADSEGRNTDYTQRIPKDKMEPNLFGKVMQLEDEGSLTVARTWRIDLSEIIPSDSGA